MDRIEEAKKILNDLIWTILNCDKPDYIKMWTEVMDSTSPDLVGFLDLFESLVEGKAKQICQLLEPRPAEFLGPIYAGEQAKPDRLLAPKRLTEIIRQYSISSEADVIELVLQIRNEQDTLTASIKDKECQERIRKAIGEEIEEELIGGDK